MRVFLEREARLAIIFAAIEAAEERYGPKETLGLLFGYRTGDGVIVRFALPYQTAKRKTSGVEYPRKESRLLSLLPELPKAHMEHVGYFHSHPYDRKGREYPPSPTDSDKQSMRNGDLEIIISLKRKKKDVEAGVRRNETVSATAGPYYYKIAAYYKIEGRIEKAELDASLETVPPD